MNNDDVLEILRLLDATGFDELRLETDRYKLLLRRSRPEGPARARPSDAVAAVPAPESPAAEIPPTPEVRAQTARSGLHEVKAPLLGTFYRAPKPGEDPFVDVGSTVDERTTVGIVEVMKLMNSVYAEVRGTVVEIPARDGELVEYGSVLMRVQPAS